MDSLIAGICGGGTAGSSSSEPERDSQSEDDQEQHEEESRRNYELLRSITPIKIHDDGVHELWYGKAHESPDHGLHTYSSDAKWQIDLQAKFKGKKKTFKRIGLEINEEAAGEIASQVRSYLKNFNAQPDEDEKLEYKPGCLASFTGSSDESNESKPGYQKTQSLFDYTSPKSSRKKTREISPEEQVSGLREFFPAGLPKLRLPNESAESPFKFADPATLNGGQRNTYLPPEDNRTMEEKINEMIGPMAVKGLAKLKEMARERYEDLQDEIRTAPTGYAVVDFEPSNGQGWNCTNGWGTVDPRRFDPPIRRVNDHLPDSVFKPKYW